MAETMTLRFGITGEFITKVAREWFFLEGKDYSIIEDLLLSCMGGTDIPEGQLKLMAQDILLGKAEFRGNSADDTFKYVVLDSPAETNLFSEYTKLRKEVKRLKDELRTSNDNYGSLLDGLRSWWEGNLDEAVDMIEGKEAKELVVDLMALYDQVSVEYRPGYGRTVKFPNAEEEAVLRETTGEPLLDSYFTQQVVEEKHKDNYGWLEPDGTFHPVPWCNHQEFAQDTIWERGWWDDFRKWDEENYSFLCGDYLTRAKGWVLLHNPGRGVAYVTKDDSKRLTKAQREFLFDYFYSRGMKDKATVYLEE